ncbi:MAG: tetratricopeptide repeat protein [Candidatus Cloacimonetes bacterium]|nr:tetratricopeptide repeat protein [Candidatus Cloacimonadota bacterium]
MSLIKNSKCKLCKVRRQQRFCLRKGRDICWECCNNIRYDRKCPEECKYSLKGGSGMDISKTNADSLTEYRGLIKNLMDLWMRMPEPELGGGIPEELARTEAGKKEVINYFKRYNLKSIYNINYIKKKLELQALETVPEPQSYEDIASSYLRLILAGDIEASIDHICNGDEVRQDEEWRADFISQKKNDIILKKMNEFKLVASALSEDKREALVFFDVNGKYDLSLKLVQQGETWQVESHYNGKMEVVNGENEAMGHIAVLLSKNELSQAEDLLVKYLSIYPDSADLHYYQGVTSALKGKGKQAKKSFLRSVRLDPGFGEALYNYGLQLHVEGELEKAAVYYERLLAIEPDNVKALNNMAAIKIDLQDYKSAEVYLKRCEELEPDFEPLQANIKRLKKNK